MLSRGCSLACYTGAVTAGRGALAGLEYLAHAMLLLILLARHAPRADELARIDGLVVAALSYMLWFVVVPLRHLLG